MYFDRRSNYLQNTTDCYWLVQCSAEPAKSGKTLSTRKQKIQIFGAKAVARSNFSSKYKLSRGGVEAERQTHNLKVAGSIPANSIDLKNTDFYQKIKGWKMFFFILIRYIRISITTWASEKSDCLVWQNLFLKVRKFRVHRSRRFDEKMGFLFFMTRFRDINSNVALMNICQLLLAFV